MVTSHFPFLDMTKLVEVLPLSTRVNLTSVKPWVSNIRQWNPLVSVSTLATGWLTSLPSTGLQIQTYSFCSEFTNLLENNINSSGELVLLEISVLPSTSHSVQNQPPSWTFWTVLILSTKWTNLYIGYPTLLTVLFMMQTLNIVPRIKVDRLFSDHNIVLFDMATPHTTTTSKVQAYRKYKEINPHAFMKDVWKFCLDKPPGPSLDNKTNHYNTMIQTILDNHAPIKSCKCSNHPKVPWFNDDIAEAIRLRRHLERNWYRDRSNVDAFTLFHCQHRLVSNLLDKAEQEFFLVFITENSLNYKHIHDICNHLLGRTKESPLPPGYTNKELADRFNNYFIDKIVKNCADLIGKRQHLPPYVEIPAPTEIQKFSSFQPITLSKLEKIILSSPSKNCELDPIPTSLLKQILPSIVGIIADIINTSLRDGIFPESLRKALVKPLLKKANLDLLDRNYRPVSNLGYASKLMEWVAAAQLVNHIESWPYESLPVNLLYIS